MHLQRKRKKVQAQNKPLSPQKSSHGGLLCFASLTAPKPPLNVWFSNNIFPSLARWQTGIILHLCCLWCACHTLQVRFMQSVSSTANQQVTHGILCFASAWATKDFGSMFFNQIEEMMEGIMMPWWTLDEVGRMIRLILSPLGWRVTRTMDFVMHAVEQRGGFSIIYFAYFRQFDNEKHLSQTKGIYF